MENKKRTLVTLGAMIMLLSTITYAYYTVAGGNNNKAQTAQLSTGTLSLTLADGDNGFSGLIEFGGTITKKFTLTNTGTLDASASISWFNLVNTYLDGSLMYTLEYSENLDGEYEKVVSNLMVPTSEEPVTTPLVTQVTVPVGKTYYYNLNITLVNSPIIDQTSDLSATFFTQFTISEASRLNASEQTLANLGLVVSNSTPDFSRTAGTILKDNGFSSEAKTSNFFAINYRTFYYSETYTFDEYTGLYSLVNPKIGDFKTIYDKLENVYTTDLSTWGQSETDNLETLWKIKSATYDSNTNTGRCTHLETIEHSILPDYSTTGIYSMDDDYGTSYYFRGTPENNYVKFAGYYWRIIRINGDGSLRIMFDGTKPYENGIILNDYSDRYISTDIFNNFNTGRASGYMYGMDIKPYSCMVDGIDEYEIYWDEYICNEVEGEWIEYNIDYNRCVMFDNENNLVDNINLYSTEKLCKEAGGKWTTTGYEAMNANMLDSNVKTVIDNWYQTNIYNKGYSNAVSDTLFCNDRSLLEGTGIGVDYSYYMSSDRLYLKEPQLTCNQQNDRFTVNDNTIGNGDLTYPVGLLTMDELMLTGANSWDWCGEDADCNYPQIFYLNKRFRILTLTPDYIDEVGPHYFVLEPTAYISGVYNDEFDEELKSGIVPVLNLTQEYVSQMIGDGTIGNEFRVE